MYAITGMNICIPLRNCDDNFNFLDMNVSDAMSESDGTVKTATLKRIDVSNNNYEAVKQLHLLSETFCPFYCEHQIYDWNEK